MTFKKIGFACKISSLDPKKGIVSIPEFNSKSTTISWLNRQSRDVAVEKLWDLMKYNIQAVKQAVTWIGNLEENLRMFRMSSEMFPAYTESNWSWFWKQSDVQAYAERHLKTVGDIARQRNVRLSFHPGQYTVLASANPNIVNKSIEEFEYHVDLARWMGHGKEFQDFKINVHIAGKAGIQGIRAALTRLSPEARNTITIENEEISYGLDDCLQLSDVVPIVLDIHHHFIREGEYIQRTDPRIQSIIRSWRGVRPVIHYSISREDLLVEHSPDVLPDLNTLLESGFNKQKLRAHSDFMWSNSVNEWAATHWEWADVMVEAKGKNLASFKLFESWKNLQ